MTEPSESLEEYEAWVHALVDDANTLDIAFGLSEEAGEVMGKFKRWYRGDYGDHTKNAEPEGCVVTECCHSAAPRIVFQRDVKRELGDLLFYLVELSGRMGVSLTELAASNKQKLMARHAAGKFKGTGDNR